MTNSDYETRNMTVGYKRKIKATNGMHTMLYASGQQSFSEKAEE